MDYLVYHKSVQNMNIAQQLGLLWIWHYTFCNTDRYSIDWCLYLEPSITYFKASYWEFFISISSLPFSLNWLTGPIQSLSRNVCLACVVCCPVLCNCMQFFPKGLLALANLFRNGGFGIFNCFQSFSTYFNCFSCFQPLTSVLSHFQVKICDAQTW